MALFLRENNIVKYKSVSGKPVRVEDSRRKHRQRLRERFAKDGLSGFHNYEVIELLLTLAKEQQDCKPAGKEAIKRFGSVRGVLDASPDDLKQVYGIGDMSVFVIKLARALVEVYYGERMRDGEPQLGNSRAVVDYLTVTMGSLDRETFRVVYLDAQHRPKVVETLFEGTLTSSAVYPREIFRKALEHNADAVILAHNHPSGCIDPSEHDRQITREMITASALLGVRVLDHIIVGANSHFSFADHGLMREYGMQARDFHERLRRDF